MDIGIVQRGLKNLGGVISKNSPYILTGLGCAGVLTTAVLTGRATLKASAILERVEKGPYSEPLPVVETIQHTWKVFVPPVLMGAASMACIIGANTINANRNAAIAALYSLSETAFREYKEKVVEQIGQNKERDVRNDIARDYVVKNPPSNQTIYLTGYGDVLCLDRASGRYFRSSPEKIRQQVVDLNYKLMTDMWVDMNTFYYATGLDPIELGTFAGFDLYKGSGRVELREGTILTPEGYPCLVLDPEIYPNPTLCRK